jgi:hypothetical protein
MGLNVQTKPIVVLRQCQLALLTFLVQLNSAEFELLCRGEPRNLRKQAPEFGIFSAENRSSYQ